MTVPEGTSTMVAIVNADVDGEQAFLYRPGGAGPGYPYNPYRVVRFKNSTPFVLEPGPIGIYAGGSFVGEGLSETVGADTSATIPFAVETGVLVSTDSASDSDEMRLVKMSRGVLEVEQFSRRTTTYTVKAITDDDGFTLLIRHNKAGGSYVLAARPDGTEDLPDGYLLRLVVPAGQREGKLTIVEQTPSRSTISIWNAPAIDLLDRLLVDASIGADAKKKLRPIIDRRREVAKLEEQLRGLTQKRRPARSARQRAAPEPAGDRQEPGGRRAAGEVDQAAQRVHQRGQQARRAARDLEAKRLDGRVELENALENFELTMPSKP